MKGEKIISIIGISLALCIFLNGCEALNFNQNGENENEFNSKVQTSNKIESVAVSNVTDLSNNYDVYSLYTLQDYSLAKFEPEKGAYLGAYILADKVVDYDIEKFESAVASSQNLYVYNMNLTDKFPTDWVLSCLAKMKTPFIVVKPSNGYDIYSEKDLINFAVEASKIKVPLFIELYPITSENPYDEEEYKKFYEKAKNIFNKYSNEIAIVWAVDMNYPENFTRYYPMDENVDWVGAIYHAKIDIKKVENENFTDVQNKTTEVYEKQIEENFDYFYQTYQKKKPLAISSLAISHYSNVNHKYYNEACEAKISEIYNQIATKYNRVKAVNYADVNEIKFEKTDNYTVTENNDVSQAFTKAISDENFGVDLEIDDTKIIKTNENKMHFSSRFNVYKVKNELFASIDAINLELKLVGITSLQTPQLINNETCYSLSELQKNGYITINEDNKNNIVYVY